MLTLKVGGLGGDRIQDEARECIELASKLGVMVELMFNGVNVSCFANNSVDEVVKKYNRGLELNRGIQEQEKGTDLIGSMVDVIQYFRHKDDLTTEEDVLLHNLNEEVIKLQKGDKNEEVKR